MKKIVSLFIIAVLVFGGCKSSKKEAGNDVNNSKIEFEDTTFDFGKIAFASDGTCIFKFKNTSDNPLVINVVRTSCGCTDPEWPKDPIEPGKSGEIKVTYNTQITGNFQKTIKVFSNAVNSPVKLLIKGEVQPNDASSSTSSKQ